MSTDLLIADEWSHSSRYGCNNEASGRINLTCNKKGCLLFFFSLCKSWALTMHRLWMSHWRWSHLRTRQSQSVNLFCCRSRGQFKHKSQLAGALTLQTPASGCNKQLCPTIKLVSKYSEMTVAEEHFHSVIILSTNMWPWTEIWSDAAVQSKLVFTTVVTSFLKFAQIQHDTNYHGLFAWSKIQLIGKLILISKHLLILSEL